MENIPEASYNSGVYMGNVCQGGHCPIPVHPTTSNMLQNNLTSANPPPGANVHYPGTVRLGNNTMDLPNISAYKGTELNNGSFNIQCAGGNEYMDIVNPKTGKLVSIFSRLGKQILKNYIRLL